MIMHLLTRSEASGSPLLCPVCSKRRKPSPCRITKNSTATNGGLHSFVSGLGPESYDRSRERGQWNTNNIISQALRISRLEFARSESSAANLFGTSHLAVSGVVFSPLTPPRAHGHNQNTAVCGDRSGPGRLHGVPSLIYSVLSFTAPRGQVDLTFFFFFLFSCQFLAAVARHRRTGRTLVHIKALLV